VTNSYQIIVVSPQPVQILPLQLINGALSFRFYTANGPSYSVLQNTNLATTNWGIYTQFFGNGSLMQLDVPATNQPRQFFRVGEP
jgi:hypothetical protein